MRREEKLKLKLRLIDRRSGAARTPGMGRGAVAKGDNRKSKWDAALNQVIVSNKKTAHQMATTKAMRRQQQRVNTAAGAAAVAVH